MIFWTTSALGLAVAYLLGSLPTGYLVGRLLRGIDIRKHGSGSTGATNALRILGKGPALAVFLIDVLKGSAAILAARWAYPWLLAWTWAEAPAGLDLKAVVPWAACLAGVAVLLGHGRSIWLDFTGGKSVATGLGVLLAISWPVGLGALGVFALALAISRIVSLSSILASVTAVILVFALDQPLPYRLMVIAGSLYVIARHRSNVLRLLAGTEPRLGQKSPESKAQI